MPSFSSLKNIFRSTCSVPNVGLPDLSHLDIPKKLVNPGIREEAYIAHLYLLESFVVQKQSVQKLAFDHAVPPESAWRWYVNAAIDRLETWLAAIHQRNRRNCVPPPDVMMVWYALLQNPRRWREFEKLANLNFEGWDMGVLLRTLEGSGFGDFQVPEGSRHIVHSLYHNLNLLDLLAASVNMMPGASHQIMSRQATDVFSHDRDSIGIPSTKDGVRFSFNFHSAVHDQVVFADQVLTYSWHRVYTSMVNDERHLLGVTKRYASFHGMLRFRHSIQCLEPLAHHPPLNFVPSLDVDFAWRTHMLWPEAYYSYCMSLHNELPHYNPSPLDYGPGSDYELSSQLYKHIFGEAYDVCLCWHCIVDRDGTRLDKNLLRDQQRLEQARRIAAGAHVPLKYGNKHCSKCGSHPHKSCKAKHVFSDSVQAPVLRHRSPSTPKALRDSEIRHLVPPSWVGRSSVSHSAPASPSSKPIRPSSQTPPPRNQYQNLSMRLPDSLPWLDQDARHSARHEATMGSLPSSLKSDEYVILGANSHRAGGDSPRSSNRVPDAAAGPDPSAWFAEGATMAPRANELAIPDSTKLEGQE